MTWTDAYKCRPNHKEVIELKVRTKGTQGWSSYKIICRVWNPYDEDIFQIRSIDYVEYQWGDLHFPNNSYQRVFELDNFLPAVKKLSWKPVDKNKLMAYL